LQNQEVHFWNYQPVVGRISIMIRIFKVLGWLAMTILALLIALASFRYFIQTPEVAIGPPLAERFAEYITPLLFHAGGGMLALSLGPWSFWGRFRNKYLHLHRWMGRIYLLSVLVGGVAGFYLAATAFGGLPASIGFSMLAALWLTTGAMAYLHIRRGAVQVHREWMIRNYALTFSAVMLRVWLPLFITLGYEFSEAYTTVAWLCWFPNLLVAELIIGNGKARAKRQKARLTEVSVRAA
jgi:uncharacterized membrane protein